MHTHMSIHEYRLQMVHAIVSPIHVNGWPIDAMHTLSTRPAHSSTSHETRRSPLTMHCTGCASWGSDQARRALHLVHLGNANQKPQRQTQRKTRTPSYPLVSGALGAVCSSKNKRCNCQVTVLALTAVSTMGMWYMACGSNRSMTPAESTPVNNRDAQEGRGHVRVKRRIGR